MLFFIAVVDRLVLEIFASANRTTFLLQSEKRLLSLSLSLQRNLHIMSFNVTAHASASALYAQAGTDFSSLNWIEQQWAAWYLWIGNPILATGIMSFVMHEVCQMEIVHVGFLSNLALLVDCLFWTVSSMDHYRCSPVLQKMETAACKSDIHILLCDIDAENFAIEQDTVKEGAMGVHQTRVIDPFHY